MPEARLQRARRTLPEGYQFGDAAGFHQTLERLFRAAERVRPILADTIRIPLPPHWHERPHEPSPSDAERPPVIEGALPWRAPHQNAAEQLVRRAGWNVIEGEEP